ncbi:MAG: LemA family protein [Alphaproteobacteria bacterium]|nr:LemA family protein [Alphaproteobacteria bacterium]
MIGLIILGVFALIIVYIISIYNGLIAARQHVDEAWSTINTQLKRRYDLIPNLMKLLKEYMKHESDTFVKVTEARTSAMKAISPADKGKAENALSGTLKSLFALSESYPELKADKSYANAQQQLADTETKIQASRQFYNSVVMTFNTKIAMFPNNILANLFHMEKASYFELDADEAQKVQQPPKIQL